MIAGNLAKTLLSLALVLGIQTGVVGQIFFTDSFDYPDGDLTTESGGLWVTHSGSGGDIQVVNGSAVVTSPGANDDNRLTGAIMGVEDVWYYALRFSVELGSGSSINNDYFIHLKDSTSANYNARLALDDPTDTNRDFSLSIWASSEGDGQADWNGDFDFGEEIIAVVEWNNATGDATLWVNPVDINSTSITDNELPDAMRAVEALALRQDGGSSSVVTIPVVSIGTDFDAVLAAVQPAGGDVVVAGESLTVMPGIQNAGGLAELEFSDNMDLNIFRDPVSTTAVTQFVLASTSPTATPTRFEFTLEGNCISRPNVVQRIEFFNYVSNSYEIVDERNANRSPNPDLTVVAAPGGDLSRFVEPTTLAIQTRIRYRADSARAGFASNTDQAVWTIGF
jgi:hypothetical protein